MSVPTSSCHWYLSAVQVTKQSCQAHVILATSEYSFITWLTDSGYLDFGWVTLTCLRMLIPCGAIAGLGVDFFEVQVIGDFPEAEARLFLEQVMGATITEAEWAEIFGVSFHACVRRPVPLLCCLSGHLKRDEGGCHLALSHVQVCGGNAGRLRSAVQHFSTLKDWTRGG